VLKLPGRGWGVLGLFLLALGLSGCLLRAVRDGVEFMEVTSTIAGEVQAPREWGRTTVVLLRESEAGTLALEASWPAFRPGRFTFVVRPGVFHVAAFREGEGGAVPADRAWWALPGTATAVRVGNGGKVSGLVLASRGEVGDAVVRRLQPAVTRAALLALPRQRRVGEVLTLREQRFSQEAGRMGLWSPGLFAERHGWGVYLLQPWDPAKTPVLLVHGAGGYPREWEHVVAELDQSRFQPIVFQYPSGMRIQAVVDGLTDMLDELHDRVGFRDLVVLAHSMGGLVARKAISRGAAATWPDDVRLLVTIATPWQGVEAARRGAGESQFLVASWTDLAPGSEFLRSIRRDPLPPRTTLALLFGFRRGRSLLSSESSDRTVALRSVLDQEAQAEAAVLRGFDEDHDSILVSEAVAAELRRLLAAVPTGR
jgi:pimeloyl-ACP methyl ester carboxylesterase